MVFTISGNKERNFNPTKYRTPAMYNDILHSVHMEAPDGQGAFCFETVSQKSVQIYIKVSSGVQCDY